MKSSRKCNTTSRLQPLRPALLRSRIHNTAGKRPHSSRPPTRNPHCRRRLFRRLANRRRNTSPPHKPISQVRRLANKRRRRISCRRREVRSSAPQPTTTANNQGWTGSVQPVSNVDPRYTAAATNDPRYGQVQVPPPPDNATAQQYANQLNNAATQFNNTLRNAGQQAQQYGQQLQGQQNWQQTAQQLNEQAQQYGQQAQQLYQQAQPYLSSLTNNPYAYVPPVQPQPDAQANQYLAANAQTAESQFGRSVLVNSQQTPSSFGQQNTSSFGQPNTQSSFGQYNNGQPASTQLANGQYANNQPAGTPQFGAGGAACQQPTPNGQHARQSRTALSTREQPKRFHEQRANWHAAEQPRPAADANAADATEFRPALRPVARPAQPAKHRRANARTAADFDPAKQYE